MDKFDKSYNNFLQKNTIVKNKKYTNTLFDNPELERLQQTIPKDYQEKQQKAGEELFKFDFEKGMVETPEISQQILTQITLMLKSGLHPSYLNEDEKDFLECKFGKEWYKHFDIDPLDLNRINM